MRLARSASLLVALSLFISAATAHGECAWVLWQRTLDITTNKVGGDLLRDIALSTRQDCHRAIGERAIELYDTFKRPDSAWKEIRRSEKGIYADGLKSRPDEMRSLSITLECWPDTVDPRK